MSKTVALILGGLALFGTTSSLNGQGTIPLQGTWQFQLDEKDQGIQQGWFEKDLAQTIHLPGTTDEGGYGKPGPQTPDRIGVLTRRHEYLGPAWYSRQIEIPQSWADTSIELFLERVMWQSQLWIDGQPIGQPQDSLCTPHVYALGKLAPGKHLLTIRIDNRMIHPIGNKNHAYGEQTQTRWNGIVGRIELLGRPARHIESMRVFPHLEKGGPEAKTAKGGVTLEAHPTGELSGLTLRGTILDLEGNVVGQSDPVAANRTTELKIDCDQPIVAWDQFSPRLYRAKVELLAGDQVIDTKESEFGFRTVRHKGNQLLINDRPAFMRGNLDCVHFVRTGYPSPHKQDWIDIFKIYKEHNLNHCRFHSWCPPEAAFEAADELGIYLQVEGPIWIDHWMTHPNPRPEMDTEGYPQGLGKNDRTIDAFAQAEFRRILDTYGDHPSFVFFCFGNELGPSDFKVTGQWVKQLKHHDPRHLYAASTARTITPFCDFNATHAVPGVGWVRQHYEFGTDWDYEKLYRQTTVPIIAHEIGQWPVYPKWSILDKFDGVLYSPRLEAMRDQAIENGVFDDQEAFTRASGAINQRMYKDEIEGFLRTPSCRGFQLLEMQDFQGQGEALVGWLDFFWDSKGTTDPKVFRGYCAPLVALARLKTYIYTDGQTLETKLLVRNNTGHAITDRKLTALLHDEQGNNVCKKEFSFSAADGQVVEVGQLACPLTAKQATPLTLELILEGKKETNTYPLWVYPATLPPIDGPILEANTFSDEVLDALQSGKTVLLDASKLGDDSCTKHASWRPLYWSVPFFPGQGIDVLGLIVRNEHPAFAHFPTPDFNDWNWYRVCKGARGFDLTGLVPNAYKPIAQPVTDFHLNRKLGSIFELKVGKGKLLVSGYRLDRPLPEVQQLRHSLLRYAASDAFEPSQEIPVETLKKMFAFTPPAPVAVPPGFEKAIFFVKAAGNKKQNGNHPWQAKLDDVKIAKDISYQVEADGIWKDARGTAWHGKKMSIDFDLPSGFLGQLYVHFHDWNGQNRRGDIVFEGRKFKLGKHDGKGVWVKLDILREDVNDGKLNLQTRVTRGGNLMISAVAIVPKE